MSVDDEATDLLRAIIDTVDGMLFDEGLEFKDEVQWETAADELRAWIHRWYDDFGEDSGEDGSYDPTSGAPAPALPVAQQQFELEVDTSGSESATLHDSEMEVDE